MSIFGLASQALGVYGGIQLAKYQNVATAAPQIRVDQIQGKTPGADNPFIPNFLEYGLTGNQLDSTCNPPENRTRKLSVTIDAAGNVISVCKAKRRKRRRRLATASDIADLIQLKATLGGGNALNSWIAKNGRC